ncbi:hypothetical protein PsYK624_065670 [Phanerochaete sordida]|uniref:Uncharacterized protein n=1 Tax=Phanerochaete sordida TaxID=48140 RepID=A0A9P3G9S8_9APHY|nr:hypothetical protein PsYK624_065670 [Phanerochaete sordida]
MSALKPTWEPHTPHSELAGYRTRHGELETRWSVLQSAVAELEGHSDSTAISVRKLSTCEIDIVRGVAELVEKVEILRGQELEASTAKVAVTPLRRDYHHSHLNVCRDSARAVVVHFNKLAAALELAARQYDSPRQSHHREGEKLLSDIRMLRDDVQAYLHKINQQIGSVQSEKTFWTAEADRAHVVFANDKEVFNRTLSLKHIEVARLTEQGETSWDLQQWSNTLNLAPIEDAREHYITSQVLKSAGRFHFCATRAAFYERHDSLLSSHHREASGLHVESMISALQSLVGSLGSPDIAAAALKSAQELSPLTEMSTRLLVQVQDASLAREFARNLADVLEAVVKTHSFDCGAINAKELLNICTNIADQPSPGYIAVPF